MAQLDRYFEIVCARKASDLHLTSGMPPLMRVHGKIQPVDANQAKLDPVALERMLLEIAPEENRREFEESSDTDFAYEFGDRARFRANLFRDRAGAGAVFRQIPREIISAEKLGLPAAILELCSLNKGLVVVTGPTGSGKSTTLAAMVDHLNRTRDDHIITIEDPVEFVHESKRCLINQREIGPHTVSFKRALRAALREDPNVIVVGEMRDLETTAIAIEMAETGHLVFGTLHTTTAASTVDRIIDQFPHEQQAQIRTMLADSLKGVIAQTLLRKKDGSGRVAALEVLLVNQCVSANIREGKTHQIPLAMQTGRKVGMCELNFSLIELVRKGVVSAEEARTKAIDKPGLDRELEKLGLVEGSCPAPEPKPAAPASMPEPPKRPTVKPGAAMGASIVRSSDAVEAPRPRPRTSARMRRPLAPTSPPPSPPDARKSWWGS
jgi:twitching motility protein PilT